MNRLNKFILICVCICALAFIISASGLIIGVSMDDYKLVNYSKIGVIVSMICLLFPLCCIRIFQNKLLNDISPEISLSPKV